MDALNKKTIEDIDVTGKRVLVRCDFNVPITGGVITSDSRITAALPTINYLIGKGAKVILCSHLGRPKGCFEPEFSLKPVAKRLSELLGKEVKMADDVVGQSANGLADSLQNGEVMMLENVRFEPGETKNDPELSKKFAALADIYVDDAFGSSHRAHSSTVGVADYLPAVCGYLIQKEISVMGNALENPKRPFVAILGGAKVSDKIGVISNLIDKVDVLLIGGGMAYTFMAALGNTVGNSLLEADKIGDAKNMMEKAKQKGIKMLIPADNLIADSFSETASTKIVDGDIPDGWEGVDIGPKTRDMFTQAIAGAGTIIWNGPMGVFEIKSFAEGTIAVAKAISEQKDAVSIVGGGDSAAAVQKLGFADKITHISTGGGASLEFLEGIELPGIAALNNK